jgi:predicted ribosomally synthesized peptide with nif11-like leader
MSDYAERDEVHMDQMKELYEKVASDAGLQAKFLEIINNAEQAGPLETQSKLLNFAKEAGYDISLEEMEKFFKGMIDQEVSELSDLELDMVAGGKISWKQIGGLFVTIVFTATSAVGAIATGGAAMLGCAAGATVAGGGIMSIE